MWHESGESDTLMSEPFASRSAAISERARREKAPRVVTVAGTPQKENPTKLMHSSGSMTCWNEKRS